MIIEQVRYYIATEKREPALEVRREQNKIRGRIGLSAGRMLIADPAPDDGPIMVWQCGYEDESAMALAEATLTAHAEYAAARDRLSTLVERVELELYSFDDERPDGEE